MKEDNPELKKAAENFFGPIQCDICKNHLAGRVCNAFEWIPSSILNGSHDHKKPYEGDKGIQFEPLD